MKISTFFVLAATLLSVVFAQEQSNDTAQRTFEVIDQSSQGNQNAGVFLGATAALKDGFTRGTNFIDQSEKTLIDALEAAGKSIDNPEAAKEIMNKAFGLNYQQIIECVAPYFLSYGEALALSNDGAEQGLRDAQVVFQKGGFSLFDQIQIAQNLINFGIDAEDMAAEILIQAVRLTVETGYTGFYHNVQESIKMADKALRDAKQAGPSAQGAPDTNCDAAEKDAVGGADAAKQINQAAQDALTRGANPALVEEYRKTIICALGDVSIVTQEGGATVHGLLPLAESDPEAAVQKYLNVAKKVKEVTYAAAAKMFVATGDLAQESGNESNPGMAEAITVLEQGKIELIKAVDAAGGVIEVGLRYKGDTPSQTIDSVARTGYYAKIAFLQALVKSVQKVLSLV